MSRTARFAIAASIIAAGWWLSGRVRHLVAYVDTSPARLGFEMLGIEVGLAMLAIGIAFALPGPVPRRLGLAPSRLSLGAVVALTIGTLGLSHAIDTALALWSARALAHSVATGISRGLETAAVGGRDFAIALFGTVFAPAIGEELLCRGLIQRSLVRWLRPAGAIAIAALVFGWLHQELVHGVIATSIGVYLGLAARWSDSTRPAIAGHAANNFAALLGSIGVAIVPHPPVPGMIAGLALAAIGVAWAWWARPRGADPLHSTDPALQPDPGAADA